MADLTKETDSEINAAPETLSAAARVGAGLKDVRERLGWKLPDLAERIRIRLVFLAAIESGDLSSLPGTAYRAGFVRSYAQALGLDGEEILQRFRDTGQIDAPEKNEIKLLMPVPDRGVPKGALIFIAFIVAVGGYGLWYYHTEQTRKVAQNVLHIPTKLQPLAAPPTVTPSPSLTGVKPEAAKAPASAAAATPSTPPPASAPASSSVAAPVNTSSAVATAPAATPEASTPPSSVPTTTGMVITATQPSWIQVTTSDGTILFSKVLNAGQSWAVPHMANLKMTTGNAGGTVISVDGKPEQPLGAEGTVLHGYQLTPSTQSSTAPTTSSNGATAAP